jgi:hypothetical protein
MKIIGCAVAAMFAVGFSSTSFAGDTCVKTDDVEALNEIKTGEYPQGPELLSTTYFLPAGASVNIILREPFDKASYYFGLIETVIRQNDRPVTAIKKLGGSAISAKLVPEDNALVQRGLADKANTMLTIDIPASFDSFWHNSTLYIWRCNTDNKNPQFVSTLTLPVSTPFYSNILTLSVIILVYLLASVASKVVDKRKVKWYRYFDPVYMTAGPDGKGSLSKLQILFFSMIVFGLLSYIVSRTGLLSNISSTVLLLLGIAGVGSAVAKATDVQRSRIDFDNWAWFIRKKWLPPRGLADVNKARWRDLVESDGEFDVYRFQNLVFSLVVGAALIAAGINELSSFTIPDTLLGGKLVSPPSCAELNTATKEVMALEREFIDSAATHPDPNPPARTQPLDPPADLAAAMRRADRTKYSAYLDRAKSVRIMFEQITGRSVNDQNIQPAFTT